MSARRWPIVTFALIAINTVVFLFTHYGTGDESAKLGEVRLHLITLAAMHPELQVPAETQQMVEAVRKQYPEWWAHMQQEDRPKDAWDAHVRLLVDHDALQEEMNSLSGQYSELCATSPSMQYGFIAAERKPLTYITATFLHAGWWHLIGNMWFLWLAGFILEDNWGRMTYAAFYLIAGAAAHQFYAWMSPESIVPTLGASGAVAGLIGAFLVRFPKLKIEMKLYILLVFLIGYFRAFRFKLAAYWLLPLWLLVELSKGSLFGAGDGINHWAHVGGFVFGGLVACAIRFSHLEHKVNQSIEQKTAWVCDPAIARASELLEQHRMDEAIPILRNFAASHPDSLEAANLLSQAYWRKCDLPAFREANLQLCALHLKAREWGLAWQCLQEVRNTTEGKIPANLWFDLCRAAENLKNYDVALSECQQLIATYPDDRHAFMAQIAAGRICLSHLQRPQDALNFFQAASASSIPHLDWEQTIQAGIRNAKAALSPSGPVATPALANR
jgi:membrane associated rhomboid family serine protease